MKEYEIHVCYSVIGTVRKLKNGVWKTKIIRYHASLPEAEAWTRAVGLEAEAADARLARAAEREKERHPVSVPVVEEGDSCCLVHGEEP